MLRISKKTGDQRIGSVLLIAICMLTASIAQGGAMGPTVAPWHAVLSVGGGVAFTSNVGNSRTFPIINPITDEYYIYRAKNSSHTTGLFDAFAGVEWLFNFPWSVQLGVAYDQIGNLNAHGRFIQGADLSSQNVFRYHYRVIARQLLGEGKLLYNYKEIYHPYLLVGLGGSFNQAKHFRTNVPPFLTFTREYANKSTNSFSYDLGLGIDFDLSSRIRLGVGYRYADFGKISLGSAIIDTTPVRGTLSRSHFNTNEILGQITLVI